MKKIITFGEVMLRLSPDLYNRWQQTDHFNVVYTGAEANVAVSLANFGMDVSYVTKVPAHEIGQSAVNNIRKFGVNTDMVVRGGERIGLFYLEKGASQRPSKVIYDRKYSAIATAQASDFNWDKIFDGADWFHLTGITPALSDELANICLLALQKAKEKGLTVSMDLNYRAKLWSLEKARQTLEKLLPYVDYCKDLFWYEDGETDRETIVNRMFQDFDLKGLFVTQRVAKNANDHDWSGVFYTGGKAYQSKQYSIHIVDRVGGGDSFSAGFIYALANGYTPQETIEFAVAASCLKHSIEGDYNLVSVDEVKTLAEGDGTGRVQR